MNGAAPTMMAIVTTGTGGTDKLEIRQVPVPVPGPEDVLLKVLAAGVNNTEINTRLGWYSSSVRGGTADAGEAGERADGFKVTRHSELMHAQHGPRTWSGGRLQ